MESDLVTRLFSARPISPLNGVTGSSRDEQLLQPPTPTPSYMPRSLLPFPLIPTMPSNPHDILEGSAQFATPMLGEPSKLEAAVDPGTISQGVALPTTPAHLRDRSSSSNAVPPESR
ncbi:hypothetical protein JB92DRAFT_1861785 [Gautieria morchelliformis]|nr:hypothetical protein JB92DRAFT_1861785 [Gautieria morchelliformis]